MRPANPAARMNGSGLAMASPYTIYQHQPKFPEMMGVPFLLPRFSCRLDARGGLAMASPYWPKWDTHLDFNVRHY